MKKEQKEFRDLLKAIRNWMKVNKNEVAFIGSFVSFDEDKLKKKGKDVVRDYIMFGYGYRSGLKVSLEALNKELKKDKNKFINW